MPENFSEILMSISSFLSAFMVYRVWNMLDKLNKTDSELREAINTLSATLNQTIYDLRVLIANEYVKKSELDRTVELVRREISLKMERHV